MPPSEKENLAPTTTCGGVNSVTGDETMLSSQYEDEKPARLVMGSSSMLETIEYGGGGGVARFELRKHIYSYGVPPPRRLNLFPIEEATVVHKPDGDTEGLKSAIP
ncbi:hypothetical protein L6452_30712 [Arctium lappa]|uniref:Uncharacterized protein n=1 Tax=Arctium lappa TaxID=4217 RepID=A0ACB8ZJA7_ARCLA|nr:hypothetical protein L6452_30712 [Arctium lappa]